MSLPRKNMIFKLRSVAYELKIQGMMSNDRFPGHNGPGHLVDNNLQLAIVRNVQLFLKMLMKL